MKKICYDFQFYFVTDIVKKKNVSPRIRKSIKRGIKAAQDFLGIKTKPKILFSYSDSDNFAEFLPLKGKKPIILFYPKKFYGLENMEEEIIKTAVHEYLHLYFHQKNLSSIFSVELEEETVVKLEMEVWGRYFQLKSDFC